MDTKLLAGRRQLVNRWGQDQAQPTNVVASPTMTVEKTQVHCLRCDQRTSRAQAMLPNDQYYCPKCLNLGRVSTLARFYHVPEPNQFYPLADVLSWQGHLSSLQTRVASEVRHSMANHEHRLLWAVTGAGKTEMIFPTVAQALQRKERVGIASPRVDVCLELYPRFTAAFRVPIALLHGRAKEPYSYKQLTICTTHQLLRFYHAFDLLIVDEVDAFPYASNKALLYATKQALKPTGGLLLMTATPGKTLFEAVRRGHLQVSYLPLRYHGHLLPEIHCHLCWHWRAMLNKGRLPTHLLFWLKTRCRSQQRFLLFVPRISDLGPLKTILQRVLPHSVKFATVYSNDPDRLTKVQAMRDHQYLFLVTTTILERGVTFPGIDVGVLGADEPVFSSSALVQIAGRVGRSAKRPNGQVDFWINEYSRSIRQAQKEIRTMNIKGRRLLSEMSAL